jgi:DNA-binding beta-propeller fold protein YncE
MPSDEMNDRTDTPTDPGPEAGTPEAGTPVPDASAPDAEAPEASAPVTVATGYAARARRRKIALLALLVLILALLTYTVAYFEANKRLPLPRVSGDAKGLEPPRYLYSISGTGGDAMTKPIGLAVSRSGRVYVVDGGTNTVKVYTTAGAYLFTFSAIDDGVNKKLVAPVHLAIDNSTGAVWVTDRMLHGVYVFSADGKFERRMDPNGDPTFPWLPLGVFIEDTGKSYFTDIPGLQVHRVAIVAKDGKLEKMFGGAGLVEDPLKQPSVFSFPNGIVVGSADSGSGREIYVADSNNRRIQVFSLSGSFRRFIRTEGTPRGIVMDSQKRIYVVDVLAHQIDIYSTSGQHLATFGEAGVGPGQFQYPEDIALDARGRIYISDRQNNQVQVWGYPALEIPGITKVAPNMWPWCFAPLLLLIPPLLLRKRRFMVTDDFIEGMVSAELVPQMTGRRWRWIVTEQAHPAYVGRVVDGVDLGQLLEPEPYSHSDATALVTRLGIPLEQAAVLAMAKRTKILCTEDGELARLAVLLGVDAYDRAAWVAKYVPHKPAE